MPDLDLTAIQSRITETPPKLATIREMTAAEIGQVLTDRAALLAEVGRLRKRDALSTAVAVAARALLEDCGYTDDIDGHTGEVDVLESALDALDAGGEA